MISENNFVLDTLSQVAKKHYTPDYGSFRLFENSIKECYRLIADRYLGKLKKVMGCIDLTSAHEFLKAFTLSESSLKRCEIPANNFVKAVGRVKVDGKSVRVPYRPCLEALRKECVINVSDSYSTARHFSKSYAIDNDFLMKCVAHYDKGENGITLYAATWCPYSDDILTKKLVKMKNLYDSLGSVEGATLILPTEWYSGCSLMGQLPLVPELNLEQLNRCMELFKAHRDSGYTHGRHYDWFTLCSSSFRRYLYVDGKPYRELVDCPSGMFVMLAIVGYQEGRIPSEECRKLINHCFSGTFYTDLSGAEKKTRYIKTRFMVSVNMDKRTFHAVSHDPIVKHIVGAFRSAYPNFWNWMEDRRCAHEKVGLKNHIDSTRIEKEAMEKLMDRLAEKGYRNLRRVHDALYGTDDCPGVKNILKEIILKYLE